MFYRYSLSIFADTWLVTKVSDAAHCVLQFAISSYLINVKRFRIVKLIEDDYVYHTVILVDIEISLLILLYLEKFKVFKTLIIGSYRQGAFECVLDTKLKRT